MKKRTKKAERLDALENALLDWEITVNDAEAELDRVFQQFQVAIRERERVRARLRAFKAQGR